MLGPHAAPQTLSYDERLFAVLAILPENAVLAIRRPAAGTYTG